MKQIRPQVDTSEPTTVHLDHLRNNLKREQLLEERYHEIDRENKILLQKMSDIMKSSTYSERTQSVPPSLNRDSRKTELMRITRENQGILKRIQRAQPVYNHVQWEDSYRRNATYLKNSSEYPLVLKRKSSSRGGSLVPLGGKDAAAASLDRSQSSRGGVGASPEPGSELGPEDLRYVLKEGKRIGERYYLVEMATDGRTLAISAYDGDNKSTLELVVNERNHRRLYRDSNGDYNAIAEKLRVEGEQLSLDVALAEASPKATSPKSNTGMGDGTTATA
eukprot:CAMPEP_0171064258 /NCGR_PEP_ID=MMETSP0766_2-20121228/6170_1 /TAXON_ID=439317 /ORGANISM="Gambierdiscus australes, Strain CAWD 149" /LENGTH=277 /DNA_ID=CAMNT_0011520267 /DNA_START=190 /DNA_END=1023 /DNA_ORIENTATION=-